MGERSDGRFRVGGSTKGYAPLMGLGGCTSIFRGIFEKWLDESMYVLRIFLYSLF